MCTMMYVQSYIAVDTEQTLYLFFTKHVLGRWYVVVMTE